MDQFIPNYNQFSEDQPDYSSKSEIDQILTLEDQLRKHQLEGTILTESEFFNLLHRAARELPELAVGGCITYCQRNWKELYTHESRTYQIWNTCNYFNPNKISKALWGTNLDGTDRLVRLDYYDWEVDYCQITSIHLQEDRIP